jgi:hypothetical protein
MYKPIEEIEVTIEDSQIIWKYMPFKYLHDLLKKNKLYCRAINKFQDRLEGNINILTEEAIYKHYFNLTKHNEIEANKMTKEHLEIINAMRQRIFVNCWHINNYENYAMWNIYGKGTPCIAIKTKFGSLCDSLIDKEYTSHAGVVKYIDFQNEVLYEKGAYTHALYKGEPYNYENELRVIVNSERDLGKDFVLIDIDTKKLIEDIYISPFMSSDERNKVKDELKQYSIKSVKDSVLIDTIKLKEK